MLPTRSVAVEFDPGTWTDVAGDVVSVSTRRGRNDDLGAYETGRAIVVLRNETRAYDPDYVAGPYYGKLRPNRPVRFRATWAGVDYPVFVGTIDRITQEFEGPNGATATIECSDRFKILKQRRLPSSVYAAEVDLDGPLSWWRLGDPAVTGPGGRVFDSAGGKHMTVGPAWVGEFGASSLAVREPDGSVEFAVGLGAGGGDGFRYIGAPVVDTPPLSVELLFNLTEDDGILFATAASSTVGGSTPRVYLQVFTGRLYFTCDNGPDTVVEVATGAGANVHDGLPHHAVGTWAANGDVKLYYDGVLVASAAGADPVVFSALGGQTRTAIGGEPNEASVVGPRAPGGFLDEVAVYGHVLTPERVAAHNAAARSPWTGDLPGARINRIFALTGDTGVTIGAGVTTLQATDLGGDVLGYLEKVAETELGLLFVDRAGTIRFLGRREAAGEDPAYLTPKATFADAPVGAGEVPYRSVTFETDLGDVVTRATVSREGSFAVTYEDVAASGEYEVVDYTAEGLLHDSDLYSAHLAEWLVNSRAAPETKVGALPVTPQAAPATAYPAVLGLELGDRVTLTRRRKVGPAMTRDYRLEAVSHSTAAATWESVFQLSAFHQANNRPVFIWGVTRWGEHVWGI